MINIVGESHLPQLLLIHGGGVGAWMWDDVTPFLEAHFQLLIVTLPYHGQTDLLCKPFMIKDYSPILLEAVKPLRNDQPIGVVGFSLGAQIGLELITIAPAFFSFAMINSASCTTYAIPFPILKWLTTLTMPLAKIKSFAKLQTKTLYIPDHMFNQYYTLSSSMTAHQLVEILHTNMNFTVNSSMNANIPTAIHITYGQKENSTIKKSARIMQQLFPQAITYTVSGVGHGFPLAEPQLFSDYIIKHFTLKH